MECEEQLCADWIHQKCNATLSREVPAPIFTSYAFLMLNYSDKVLTIFFNRKNFGVMEFPRWVSCVHVLLVACLHIFKIRIPRIWPYSIWKYVSLFETKSHSFFIFIEQYPFYHVPLYFLYEWSSRKRSCFSNKKATSTSRTYITHHACEARNTLHCMC